MDGPVRTRKGGVEITLWVVPGARRSEVMGRHGDALRIRVAQPPAEGRANRAVVELLGESLGARVSLASGRTSRRKVLRIEGMAAEEVRRRLDL